MFRLIDSHLLIFIPTTVLAGSSTVRRRRRAQTEHRDPHISGTHCFACSEAGPNIMEDVAV